MIDRYEEEAESFLAELEEEYYRNGAGLKDTCDLGPIYDRYASLFSPARVKECLAHRHSRRERHLAEFAALQYLDRSVCLLTDRIATAETQAVLEWDGEEISYRLGLALVPKERDRRRRLDLVRRVHAVTAEANGYRLARLAELHRQAEQLGFDGYCQLCDELIEIDLERLGSQMESLLEKSASCWQRELHHFMSAEGIPPQDAHIADLRYILTAPQFEDLFPRDGLMPALEQTLHGLGIDLRSLENLKLDTEQRPLKSPRAFCSPIRVPSDVRLVIMPRGGREDYNALFHEAGHALHFAHTNSSAPFAYRTLGDNSVTEAYAFLLNLLLRSPMWLREVARIPPERPYLRFARFYQLYYLRRLAARLAYERELHAAEAPTAELADVYAHGLGASLGVQMVPENYLADVDDRLYCTCYLRAWMLEVQLRRRLGEQFGERWFGSSQAGDFLKELWGLGQEFSAPELGQRLGYQGLELGPLLEDLLQQ